MNKQRIENIITILIMGGGGTFFFFWAWLFQCVPLGKSIWLSAIVGLFLSFVDWLLQGILWNIVELVSEDEE